MTDDLKTMYDRSVLELDQLYQQLAARDQLITGMAALVGPVRLDLAILDEVHAGKWTGFDIEANEDEGSITISVKAGESDELEQGSEESK